jgi:hypothetical protein
MPPRSRIPARTTARPERALGGLGGSRTGATWPGTEWFGAEWFAADKEDLDNSCAATADGIAERAARRPAPPAQDVAPGGERSRPCSERPSRPSVEVGTRRPGRASLGVVVVPGNCGPTGRHTDRTPRYGTHDAGKRASRPRHERGAPAALAAVQDRRANGPGTAQNCLLHQF